MNITLSTPQKPRPLFSDVEALKKIPYNAAYIRVNDITSEFELVGVHSDETAVRSTHRTPLLQFAQAHGIKLVSESQADSYPIYLH